MKVQDILEIKGSRVYSIGCDQTVLDAVALLMEHRIGALLVLDPRARWRGSSASAMSCASA